MDEIEIFEFFLFEFIDHRNLRMIEKEGTIVRVEFKKRNFPRFFFNFFGLLELV